MHATALAFDKAGNLLVGTESPGPRPADRSRRQGVRAARLAVSGDPVASIRRQGHAVRRGRERPRRRRGAARAQDRRPQQRLGRKRIAAARRSRPSRQKSPRSPSSTCPAAAAPPRPAARIAARQEAPSTASRRTACGISSGNRATTRRTISSSTSRGDLIVGTGNKGKIYRLEGDPLQPTLLAGAGAQQVTALYKDPKGRLYFATANPGKLFRLDSDRATRGTYESEPRDARTVATWGALSWRGTVPPGGRVEVFTRSGNTDTPDDTWSPWSSALHRGRGLSRHQPQGALSSVAGRADRHEREPGSDVGHGRVPSAKSSAAGPLD